MSDDRKFSRVYHEAVDDPRFATVWTSDSNLALWLRLLVVADGTWPAPAPIPRSAKPKPLAALVTAGLVELVSGDLYRIHGMDAERTGRSRKAAEAARARWSAPSNAAGNARSNADASDPDMPSRDKTRQDKDRQGVDETSTPLPPASGGTGLRADGDSPRQRADAARQTEREARRQESMALQQRYLRGEINTTEYERLKADIGKEPDDLTRLEIVR